MPDIYHFTHIENLPGILGLGALQCHRDAGCLVDIADESIKAHRMRRRVPIAPGGTVCDYVPFYFAARSPMLYRLQSEGLGREDVVYFVSRTERVGDTGSQAVVTDGNARSGVTEFHVAQALPEVVDWQLMRERYWRNTDDDGDRVRRRQAEFLVYRAMPVALIDRLAVATEQVRSIVNVMLNEAGLALPIVIEPDWYFAL